MIPVMYVYATLSSVLSIFDPLFLGIIFKIGKVKLQGGIENLFKLGDK
jgi:hypothetical protein